MSVANFTKHLTAYRAVATDMYEVPDAVNPIHAVSHVATDKELRTPPSSGLFLATIYNQSQLAER